MEFLPKWVLPNTFPAVYEFESMTATEQTARVYGAMQTLIAEYNKFADSVNTALATFTENETEARKAFEADATKVYRQFACQMQDYLKLNLDDTATKVILEGMNNGSIPIPTDSTLRKSGYPAEAAATGKMIADRAAALANEIAVERARITNLASLEEGSTTGDAELADIRVGCDGKIYPTAGDAVRKQLNTKVDKQEVLTNIELELLEGICSYNSMSISSTTMGRYKHTLIPVSEGEVYKVTCYSNNAEYCGAFAYNSESGAKARLLTGDTLGHTEEIIEIPAGYDTLYLNTIYQNSTYPLSAKKQEYIAGYAKAAEVEQLSGKVDQLYEKVEQIYSENTEYVYVEFELRNSVFSYNSLTVFDTNKSDYKHTLIPVSEGEVYKVTCYSNNAEYCGAFAYNSESGAKARLLTGDTLGHTEEIIEIPAGYDTLCLNTMQQNVNYPLSAKKQEYIADYAKAEEIENANFEISNLERRVLKAEKGNDFAWKTFDKPYFVFIHDDTNSQLETFAEIFINAGVPLGAATIPSRLNDTHIATLQNIVSNGGEVLAHYSGSPTEESTDEEWLTYTRDIKKALEANGFAVRGIIRADSTAAGTAKGEKYCRKYFDYANDKMGQSTQYNINRKLMLNYSSLDAFKAQIDSDVLTNGIHGYGFHGGRDDEAWITADALTEIFYYIATKGGVITTYSELFDTFGSNKLEERLTALENAI